LFNIFYINIKQGNFVRLDLNLIFRREECGFFLVLLMGIVKQSSFEKIKNSSGHDFYFKPISGLVIVI